ncbi:MAG: hypothetical protein WA996_12005 [Candidatus Promineifilaceae bacterium]
MPQTDGNWKTKVLVSSALMGAVVGLATGYLLSRTANESGGKRPEINTMDAIKAVVGVIGVMRGIAALGSRK